MWLWVKTVVPWRTPKFCKTGVSTPIPIWTYSWKLLEWFLMTLYIFIYLIKVCEDVFNVFTHSHSVAVPQSANLESPTARWWQRKGRAGSFQGAQRVALFQTCPAWSSTMFNPSRNDHVLIIPMVVLYGFYMGFSWVLILGGSISPKPSIHGTWRHGWAPSWPGWISQSAGPRVASKTWQVKAPFLVVKIMVQLVQWYHLVPCTCSPKFSDLMMYQSEILFTKI